MESRTALVFVAIAIVLLIVLIAVMAAYKLGKCKAALKKAREGFLIYPYLDLTSPGERLNPYAMSECGGQRY